MRNGLILALVAGVLASPSYAQTAGTAAVPDCQQLSILVNFTISAPTYEAAKGEFDQRMVKLDNFVKTQNVRKFQVQSLSYNMQRLAQNAMMGQIKPPPAYQLTGNGEYQVESSESAFKLGQFLTQEKFEVTVSNKNNKNVTCPTQPGQTPGSVPPYPVINSTNPPVQMPVNPNR